MYRWRPAPEAPGMPSSDADSPTPAVFALVRARRDDDPEELQRRLEAFQLIAQRVPALASAAS